MAVSQVLGLASCWAVLASAGHGPVSVQTPEQIHIGLGHTPDEIVVHWTTMQVCGEDGCPKYEPGDSFVSYGLSPDALWSVSEGSSFLFHDEGKEQRNFTMHTASLKGLTAGTEYHYIVGGNVSSWSMPFAFRTAPDLDKDPRPVVYAVYGDLGEYNGQAMSSLQAAARRKSLDVIVHVGDFAYNMDNDNGRNGDAFMRDIEPVAATVPYMVCLGNHEASADFNHYTQRFRNMPSNSGNVTFPQFGSAPNNWWFSWNSGLVHFVAISTEVYFDYPNLVPAQYAWLEADLAEANKNRGQRPWVVVYGHRPCYCSCDGDCYADATKVRMGLSDGKGGFQYGLEELLFKHGADVYIAAHEHNYERMYDVAPSYNKLVPYLSGKTTRSTHNPPATTYIVTGSAASVEQHEPFVLPKPSRSAARWNTYGWSRMTVHNATHLYWEQVQTDHGEPTSTWEKVIDATWIVQEHHGSFAKHPRASESADTEELTAELQTILSQELPVSCRGMGADAPQHCSAGHDLESMVRLGHWQYTKARAASATQKSTAVVV